MYGIIGSGSWATALAKILTDNGLRINWWIRNATAMKHMMQRGHNPQYLPAAYFDTKLLELQADIRETVQKSDKVIVAIPSSFAVDALEQLETSALHKKKVISAIKGILPERNILLNGYLEEQFGLPLDDYFAVLGPCHAEEVAAERLSYLTFSGVDVTSAGKIASDFNNAYINTSVNADIVGVQYAAVLKNIYALGAGIAHGLDYGDNFLSVYIANSADEMAGFLRKAGIEHIVVGEHSDNDHRRDPNYAASVYLGDLLVTCYSPHSRNRTLGAMIGKGYSVKAAQLEMNMIAEGYNASRCIHNINKSVEADLPIAGSIYKILWENLPPAEGFKRIEKVLV